MKRSISFRPTLLAIVLATTMPVAHAAVPKDMLLIGKAADPQTLDPAVTIDNNDWTVPPVACSSPVATLTLPMRCRWINSTP